ncbi:hypothetical protein CJJ23_04510 [Mycoplasmopsis agassizii]|uniref:ECF transporter S component n=1 Tax=Mycoplasmopsis agassizii TaxID=33922 RepID=A0A269TJS7_9BACT|nr:ECF transporter S component [Mycoplasmopsis agassizii]PAK20975.1 hypothetical protein CJJ23_04510 [Mycoplasmopsis agassizii]
MNVIKWYKNRHERFRANRLFYIKTWIYLAFYLALILILSFIPYTGYIKLGLIDFTTLPIIMVVASLHLGWSGGSIVGFAIGLGALIAAHTRGDASGMFYFPDVSVLPRFLTGLIVGLTSQLLIKERFKNVVKVINIMILGALAVLLNTTLVTAFIFLHNAIAPFQFLNSVTLLIWLGFIYVNFIVEIIFALILAWYLASFMLYIRARFRSSKLISI